MRRYCPQCGAANIGRISNCLLCQSDLPGVPFDSDGVPRRDVRSLRALRRRPEAAGTIHRRENAPWTPTTIMNPRVQAPRPAGQAANPTPPAPP